ncbi:MMPL family transporter [Sulfurimonas lithotrophica]|uniref:MMPL family transporter n=1 Tax=Sulfurimonas lithotrophica TaxID=2590022 RepID=A0A5P8P325_9BACT|nr:MMPL family transporter [Sulfurimonas lithotrophica]QFR50138.1 MMPL family transporter [Sulfurimonas lithotrophica]
MNWRTKSENKLKKMGDFIGQNPKKIIFIMLSFSILLISNLPKITIDTSTEGFLHKQDPALILYEEFKEQFGQDEKIMVVIKTKDIFDISFLKKLRKIHNELENSVPHLNDITSLLNARNTRGENETLIVEDLIEVIPDTKDDVEKIRSLANNNIMYRNLLLNPENTLTTIILEPSAYEGNNNIDALAGFTDKGNEEKLEFLSDTSKSEMVDAVNKIKDKYSSENFEVVIAGSLAVNDYNKKSVQKDMQKFVKLVLLMMMIFLFIVFRRVSAIFLPIFIVAISLLSTIGVMAYVGTPITIPTQILPSFLLAVGIGAVVHLLAMFYKHLNENDNRLEAISYSLGHSGLAIIMTSLTTAAGLLSFSSAEIAPIADLGVFAALGVMIALLNTIVFLPAILALLPIKAPKKAEKAKSKKIDAFLDSIAVFSFAHAKKIVIVSIFIFIGFIYAATFVEFKHDPLSWQPDNSPIKLSTDMVDHELRGSVTMEVIIDTKKENGLYNSELLHKIDALAQKAQEIQNDEYFVGKAWSVAEVLKEIHKALHNNDDKYYAITDNDALIPQEFLLFENSGSDDLEDVVDSMFSKARITFKLPWMEAGQYTKLSDEITSMVEDELGSSVEVSVTGMVPLFQRTLSAAMDSMAVSYIIAFILIAIMMTILLGSVKIGLTSMIPNILPVIMSLGFMSMVNMPLDMFTMLVGAIVIGLSVDDTVHFFHNFARYHHMGHNVKESVEYTMVGTGRALVATTIVLSLGFYVYMFATLNNLINFGILAGGAITIALFSNILLGPALLTLITKDKNLK